MKKVFVLSGIILGSISVFATIPDFDTASSRNSTPRDFDSDSVSGSSASESRAHEKELKRKLDEAGERVAVVNRDFNNMRQKQRPITKQFMAKKKKITDQYDAAKHAYHKYMIDENTKKSAHVDTNNHEISRYASRENIRENIIDPNDL